VYGSWLVSRSILMIGEDVGYSTGFERDDLCRFLKMR
jgi:hypothetical protein